MIQVTQGLIKVRSDRPGLRLWWSLWGLLLLGVILTLLLVWQQRLYGQSATDGIMMPLPGCGPGQPCEAVLTSPYGRVLGKPLSYWGLAFYGLVAVTLLISAFAWQLPIAPPFSLMLPVVTSIGFTAAVWTSGVMFFVLGQFCGYCVALHVVNVALFGVSIEYAREDWRIRQRRRWEVALPPFPSTPVAVHVFLGLLVATTQVLAMSMFHGRVTTAKRLTLGPTTLGVRKLAAQPLKLLSLDDGAAAGADGEPESDGDGRPETIWTILGSRDAPYRLVVYSCPTCPTCAALHKVLSEIVARYPQQLRVDVRFWPLWHTCNDAVPKGSVSDRHRAACDLVRYALAVAAVDPEAFPGYLDWLYGRAADVNEPLAETEARVRVDQEAFDKARDSVAVWQRFNDDIELGYRLGLTSVPQLFLEQGQVYGGVTVENLDQLLTRLYGFPPVAGQGVNLRPVWLDPDYLQKKAKDTEDLRARGLYAEAVQNYQELLKVKNDWADVAVRLAWLLATCPEDKIRDGKQAVHYAQLARQIITDAADNDQVQRLQPEMLDALAAAYAEAGDFERAQHTAKAAMDAYYSAQRLEEAVQMNARWEMYKLDEPYRDLGD